MKYIYIYIYIHEIHHQRWCWKGESMLGISSAERLAWSSVSQCFVTTKAGYGFWSWTLPSGNSYSSYGKSPFLISKSTINRPFSIAILFYWRVCGMKPAQKTCAISRFCLKQVCWAWCFGSAINSWCKNIGSRFNSGNCLKSNLHHLRIQDIFLTWTNCKQ